MPGDMSIIAPRIDNVIYVTWAKASRQSDELIFSFFFLSFTIHSMMSNAQQTELSVISTHHVIYGARAGT